MLINIDISDWKTYKNTKYNYEIRYPEAGEVDASNLKEVHILFIQSFEMGLDVGENIYSFTIKVENNPLKLSPQKWAEGLKEGRKGEKINVNKKDSYKIEVFCFDSMEEHIFLMGMV